MAVILANDGIEASAKLKLEAMGHVVDTKHYDDEALKEKIKHIDCIIVRSKTKLRQPILEKALETKQLKLIIRAGVGIDNIDHVFARAHGVNVQNTPKASSDAVAELALAEMFVMARYIVQSNITMRDGKWEKKAYQGIELSGKTLGLVGFGRIAQSLAYKASALGMKVCYHALHGQKEGFDQFDYVSFETLLNASDFVSLHIPFQKGEPPLMDEKAFSMMKQGAYFINTSRGHAIDEQALIDALDRNHLKMAALDVYTEEPVNNKKIYTHEKIALTPHIGAATNEAQFRIGLEIIELIKTYI